jgi:quercetin dioxygenase-like cupin family protein
MSPGAKRKESDAGAGESCALEASNVVSAGNTADQNLEPELKMIRSISVIAILMCIAAGSLHAQDAAAVNPKTIVVKLDNERVRLFEATLTPGWKENPHSHPSSIIYVLEGGRVRNHLPDGTTSEATYTAGQTVYRDPTTHWAENIGDTTIRLIVVELKPQASASTP